MRRVLLSVIVLFLLISGVGCPGVRVGASCKRNPDGSIECSIEAHREGKHAEK